MRTVAIVGGHTHTRMLVDWGGEYDIWVFNESASIGWPERVDAVFQLHNPMVFRNANNQTDPNHWGWLSENQDTTVYMQDHYADVPRSTKYPLEEICETLLSGLWRVGDNTATVLKYFTSTVAYSLALAIYQGYECIKLFGVEMASDTEYAMQRPCVMFWIGLALGRGIRVEVSDQSGLFRGFLYGYQGDVVINRQRFETVSGHLTKELELKQAQCDLKHRELNQAWMMSGESKTENLKVRFFNQAMKLNQEYIALCMELGQVGGALAENQKYMIECDDMIRAVGGQEAADILAQQYEIVVQEPAGVTDNGK